MSFVISCPLVKGKNITGNPFQDARHNGDFRVTKHFVVKNSEGKTGGVEGKLVQFIQKNTSVTHYLDKNIEETLNTSAAISAFTKNKVNNMCDSYLEIFDIKDGHSTFDDAFQNGAIVPYERGIPVILQPKYDKDNEFKYVTKGTIVHSGLCVFIPQNNVDELYKLPWCRSKATPANGLEFIPINPSSIRACQGQGDLKHWEKVLELSKSNIIQHTVRVTWGYWEESKSKIVENSFRQLKNGGKRKTRQLRKQRIQTRRRK